MVMDMMNQPIGHFERERSDAVEDDTEFSGRFGKTLNRLLDEQNSDGVFEGELSDSALSTATAVSALAFFRRRFFAERSESNRKSSANSTETSAAFTIEEIDRAIDGGIQWLGNAQNADGGWSDTDKSYSNISTTMLVVAALTAADRADAHSAAVASANAFIDARGGIDGLKKRYGKDKTFAVPILANCAMAGLVAWKEVSALPFEAACVPQRFYNWMRLPVVSYAIPALVAIGQCKFIHDPPWDPVRRFIRRQSIARSLAVLERMQPASGGYLEAIPLTSFVCMALTESGRVDSPVVTNGIRFLMQSLRWKTPTTRRSVSWPIDTNLATWGTTLAINAMAECPTTFESVVAADPDRWRRCVDWLLSCQQQGIHPFTGAAPGGWGWTDLSGAVPDADDTPGAVIALRHVHDLCYRGLPGFDHALQNQARDAADRGLVWLANLQNRDLGWPTFCRGWGTLPFDRSGSDLTAHAVRAFLRWSSLPMDRTTARVASRAIETGFRYLERTQRPDGSWLPLWFGNQDMPDDGNPCYGTAKVLMAYADAGRLNSSAAQNGLTWLLENQHADGGFGGGPSVQWSEKSLGNSTVEETALCARALSEFESPEANRASSLARGWLERAVDADAIATFHPIGFYFAKLWYHERLYPLVFATAAMAGKPSGR